MFPHLPSPEEVSEWFARFKLHEGLEHARYIGGIVCIENTTGYGANRVSTWVPYVNATARIAYFWDWCDKNGLRGQVDVSDVDDLDIELPRGTSRQAVMRARVSAIAPTGEVIREATGQKQVNKTIFKKGYNGAPGYVITDNDFIMKAETGSVARAMGMLGMLTLPGSGIATAEDMGEYLRAQENSEDAAVEPPPLAPQTKAVASPKRA